MYGRRVLRSGITASFLPCLAYRGREKNQGDDDRHQIATLSPRKPSRLIDISLSFFAHAHVHTSRKERLLRRAVFLFPQLKSPNLGFGGGGWFRSTSAVATSQSNDLLGNGWDRPFFFLNPSGSRSLVLQVPRQWRAPTATERALRDQKIKSSNGATVGLVAPFPTVFLKWLPFAVWFRRPHPIMMARIFYRWTKGYIYI